MGAFHKSHRAHVKRRLEEAYDMFPRLRERRSQLAGSLSGGEAQMLAMARGLMSDPRLLIIDEPSLGLAPLVVNELFDILAQLKTGGRTIILVEQNTNKALSISNHFYLMRSGKPTLDGKSDKVMLDTLHEKYFSR
jgi:branched-chain amino acid transport system ATP-binding protein